MFGRFGSLAAVLLVPGLAMAGNSVNRETVDLSPIPMPVEYACDMDRPVAFDASAKVVVECPDAAAVQWLDAHFAEWYAGAAPKAVAGTAGLKLRDGDEAYAAKADGAGVAIGTKGGTLRDCVIESCKIGNASKGPGIYMNSANALVTGCQVRECGTDGFNNNYECHGVYIDNGTLDHTLVVGCKNTNSYRDGKKGTAAVYLVKGTVRNCTFERCNNGILFIANGGTKDNPAVIQGCSFKDCRTGLYYSDNANLIFRRNTIVDSGVRLDRNPRAVFTHNRFLGGRTTIQLVYAKGKAADGMGFTDNVFDRTTNLMVREGEVWDLQKVNAYFATEGNRAVVQQR